MKINQGDVILKPIVKREGKICFEPFSIKQIDDDSSTHVFRAIRSVKCNTRHFVISNAPMGIICFFKSGWLPDNFIGFKVLKVNRNKKSCFVDVILGGGGDLLSYYKFKKGGRYE